MDRDPFHSDDRFAELDGGLRALAIIGMILWLVISVAVAIKGGRL
jgi:hypothetical protein